jgi:cyclopropane-fatty-acyl-phospholipid synthase
MLAIDILERFLSTMDRRSFAVELWDGRRYDPAPNSHAEFVLRVNTPHALTRLFWRPTMLSLGEAFVTKELEIEGDLLAAIALGDRVLGFRPPSREIARLGLSWLLAPRERPPAGHRARFHRADSQQRRSKTAIRFHYDQPIDFWKLWLDSALVYSCAYFRSGSTGLDTAQRDKLDQICCKLDLRRGDRFLDLGCGWGGLLLHAVECYGVHAEGVTLSAAQATYVNTMIKARGLAGRASVHCVDLRGFTPKVPFDKIASVGVVEHIPRSSLAAYFRHVATMLSPDGHFFNQGITYAPSIGLRGGESFFNTYVFPGGSLVPLGEMVVAAETAGFSVEDTECLRSHYARTLICWRERLISNRNAIIAATDESTYRVFNLYLAGAALDFMRGRNSVYQMVLRPPASSGSVPPPREGWHERMQPRITRQSPVNRPL